MRRLITTARLKADIARAAAVERIDDAADRCAERPTSGKGKGRRRDHGKAQGKGTEKRLAKCLTRSV